MRNSHRAVKSMSRNQLGAIAMQLRGQSVPHWMSVWGTQDDLVWWKFETQYVRDLINDGKVKVDLEQDTVEQDAA